MSAEPWAGGCRSVCGTLGACHGAEQPLDLVKEDLGEGSDGGRAVGKHAAQSLRHRDHPLPHGHWRDDVIGAVGGGLHHVATVA